jgi:hypothetical protein
MRSLEHKANFHDPSTRTSCELAKLSAETSGEGDGEEVIDQGPCGIGNETKFAFRFFRQRGLRL